jgi:hypothetical protein
MQSTYWYCSCGPKYEIPSLALIIICDEWQLKLQKHDMNKYHQKPFQDKESGRETRLSLKTLEFWPNLSLNMVIETSQALKRTGHPSNSFWKLYLVASGELKLGLWKQHVKFEALIIASLSVLLWFVRPGLDDQRFHKEKRSEKRWRGRVNSFSDVGENSGWLNECEIWILRSISSLYSTWIGHCRLYTYILL